MLLIVILFVSLVIPKLEFATPDIMGLGSDYVFELGEFQEFLAFETTETITKTEAEKSSINYLLLIYLAGVVVFSVKAIVQIIKILAIYKRNKVVTRGDYKIIATPNSLPPFSFFYWIFLPEDEIDNQKMKPIIEHESIHARQWHTFDLLITELFCIYLWFVPFVYSFKNSIKSVHEFLADEQITRTKHAKIDYLNLLADYTEKYTLIGLSNNFYCSTLKNRITMITKNKTSKFAGFKYLLVIPAFALLVQFFACNSENAVASENTNQIEPANHISKLPTFISPLSGDYEISADWGNFYNPFKKKEMFHKGVDLKAKQGKPIMAIADGEVIKVRESNEGYGNLVAIKHANDIVSLYAHMSTMNVAIGNKVKQGDVIGAIGNTGMSTGPHLHLEIRKDGEKVNPNDFIKF